MIEEFILDIGGIYGDIAIARLGIILVFGLAAIEATRTIRTARFA